MKSRIYQAIALLAVCLFNSCQTKDKAVDSKPAIAILDKTTYRVGDTMSVQLSQPLAQASVAFDTKAGAIIRQSNTALTISSSGQSVGLHQLIVSGKTTANQSVTDTLTIELWSDRAPVTLQYTVLQKYPHQTTSFTQGLEFRGKTLYESTGLNGQSKLMQIDVPTGSIVKSVPLPDQYFGEGITILNNKIYQLTWTSGIAFRYSMDFQLEKSFQYHTQGWGLTHRDSTLILSDGTNRLYFLTPDFQLKGQLGVYDNNGPVMNLNELEYVDGYVFANVWQTNRIVQIDLASGKVVGNLMLDSLVPPGSDPKTDVLNGIAFQPQENAFYSTGKNWPTLYKLKISPILTKSVALR